MAPRYSNILKAAEYKVALDNYIASLRKAENNQSKRVKGGTLTDKPRTELAIVPFGINVDAGEFIRTGTTVKSWEKLKSYLGTRVKDDQASMAKAEKKVRFHPARVTLFEPSNVAGTYKKSAKTGLFYPKRDGDTYSTPLGAASETEEFATAAAIIKAALKKAFPKSYTRVNVKAEVIPV